MALGLNIVVGYAGLLDLGYVAFYAVGAYTAAWLAFASQQFDQVTFQFGASASPDGPGIHVSIWLVLPIAGRSRARRASSSACRRCGSAATTSRSSRSASGRSSRRSSATPTASVGFDLTHGTFGITPIDSRASRDRRRDRSARELPVVVQPGASVLLDAVAARS